MLQHKPQRLPLSFLSQNVKKVQAFGQSFGQFNQLWHSICGHGEALHLLSQAVEHLNLQLFTPPVRKVGEECAVRRVGEDGELAGQALLNGFEFLDYVGGRFQQILDEG